ncbi:MAG: DUF4375 domain-containing protein [Aestuariivirga sp.]
MQPYKVKISKREISADPYIIWNSFIELIGITRDRPLSPIQLNAHYCFRYESEVQNGGHLQFFENNGLDFALATHKALAELEFTGPESVLADALKIAFKMNWGHIETAEQFVAEALEGRFDKFDDDYYNLDPPTIKLLEQHLEQHQDEYIEIVD